MTADAVHARAVRRFIVVSLIAPAVLVAVGVVIQLIALPHVPANVAVHWNAAGEADRFAPAWAQPLVTILFGLGIPALIALLTLPAMQRGDRGASFRLMGSLAAGTSALTVVALTWTFTMQAGVTESSAVPSVWPALIAALVAGVGAGVAAWFAQPTEEWPSAGAVPASPLALAAGERAVWLRTATMSTGAAITILVSVIVLALVAVAAWITGASTVTAWLLTGVTLLLVLFTATTVAFHVRVDERGLSVVSVAGLPRMRVPLDDIVTAARVHVEPMGEFGGWGLRWSTGRRFGVVLRPGDAIEVTRRNGRRFVVTVDDAQTGAALLEALRARDAAPARGRRENS